MARTNRHQGDIREQVAMRHILNAIRRMRFGVITLIIQDGIVIQIDQTEKTRLDYSQSLEQEGSGI